MSEETNAVAEAFGGSENLPATFSPNALMQSTSRLPVGTDKPYLSFRDGEWTYGQEAAECEEGSLWALNPHSFMFGLIEWLNGVAGGEILVPAGAEYHANDVALKFDPEDPDHRIAPQIAVDMYCVCGEDEGLEVQYKTSTRGGVDALNKLAQKIAKQASEDADNIVAVVELGESSYMHKKHKRKTYVPILDLVWFDDFAFSRTDKELGAEDGEAEQEPDPKPEPEPEPEPKKEPAKAAAPAKGKTRGKKAAGKKAADNAPPPRRRRKAAS